MRITFIVLVILCGWFALVNAEAQTLPDNPVPQQCEKSSYDLNGHIQFTKIPCSDFPETFTPVVVRRPGFFTFRKSSDDKPLRTNKEVLKSRLFLALHIAAATSFLVDNRVTHSAREHGDSEWPAIAGITALDYMADRLFTRAFSVEAPIYAIQHYIRDAVK